MKRTYNNITNQSLYCRTFNHSWEDITGIIAGRKLTYLQGRQVTTRCSVCNTVRSDVYSIATGELMCRAYDYPDHYRIGKWDGDGSLKMQMRLEYLARINGRKRRGVGGKAIAK